MGKHFVWKEVPGLGFTSVKDYCDAEFIFLWLQKHVSRLGTLTQGFKG